MICFEHPHYSDTHSMWFIAHQYLNHKMHLAMRNANFHHLYHNTELAAARDLSPLALKIDSCKLFDAICEDLQNDQLRGGFYTFADTLTDDQILTQLRARMFVKVSAQDRALLHYYNPKVLEALLCHSKDSDTQSWLSELVSISWYSTYADPAETWCAVHNLSESAHHDLPSTPWLLTASQITALNTLKD